MVTASDDPRVAILPQDTVVYLKRRAFPISAGYVCDQCVYGADRIRGVLQTSNSALIYRSRRKTYLFGKKTAKPSAGRWLVPLKEGTIQL